MENDNDFSMNSKRLRNAVYVLYYFKNDLERSSRMVNKLNKIVNHEHDFGLNHKDKIKNLKKYSN